MKTTLVTHTFRYRFVPIFPQLWSNYF